MPRHIIFKRKLFLGSSHVGDQICCWLCDGFRIAPRSMWFASHSSVSWALVPVGAIIFAGSRMWASWWAWGVSRMCEAILTLRDSSWSWTRRNLSGALSTRLKWRRWVCTHCSAGKYVTLPAARRILLASLLHDALGWLEGMLLSVPCAARAGEAKADAGAVLEEQGHPLCLQHHYKVCKLH